MGRRGLALPPWTIRARLTLLYGLVFLITGAVLLTTGYILVRNNLNVRLDAPHRYGVGPSANSDKMADRLYLAYRSQLIHSTLSAFVRDYIVALALTTAISVAAGWWLAGRALAPLRKITATAQLVSSENLGERISLEGPADELKTLADTFDGMLSRLDAAFASHRHFVANASHELRTPLAIMRTEVDVALADPDATAADLRLMGEELRDTIDRSEALIAALLALARSEAVTVAERPVDVAELAGDCITDLYSRMEGSDVELRLDLEPAVAIGDPALLERLLANLIDNGIRHNVPGGFLAVSTGTVDDQVEIVVRNSGQVITAEQVSSLTQPFRRLSRKVDGFGLGLSIVDSVVKAHAGQLVVSAPAEGGLDIRVRVAAETQRTDQGLRLPRPRPLSRR